MLNFHPFKTKSFAIDLGNNNTLLMDRERVLLSEPSYIAFDSSTRSVKAIGEEAYNMYEKNPESLNPVKPLKGGVIADFESASAMIRLMVKRLYPGKFTSGFDQIIAGIPYSTTEVERRALRDAMDQFGARKSNLIFEPLAAALGMGLNIREPDGKMIVDIGGGITEIVVISLSGIAVFKSLKVAGDTFDRDIQDYVRKKYNVIIGLKTAEQIKLNIGSVVSHREPAPLPFMIKGKDVREGIPVTHTLHYYEVAEAIEKSFDSIERSLVQVMEVCPPELAGDIYQNGIHLTGGGALLSGIQTRLQRLLGIPVHVDAQPLLSVSKGASLALRESRKFSAVLVD